MDTRTICITANDKRRLEELLAVAKEFGTRARKDLESLTQELSRAQVVPPTEVRPDVVTMNSKVVLHDLDSHEELTYTLVFPKEANYERGAISVLAPIGTAILGYSKGETVEWPVPAGTRRLRIQEVVYQPEAAGDYHL